MLTGHLKIENKGITAVVLSKDKILLVKRRRIPFISHPGIWYFVSGAKERDEQHIDTAYREIKEETGLLRQNLKLLCKGRKIIIVDHKRHTKWEDNFYIFGSKTEKIKLNLEHSSYKWATFEELKTGEAIESIYEKDMVLKLIKLHIQKSRKRVSAYL